MQELTPEDIKAARYQTGLSQRAFADALSISRRTVEDWEKGINKPPPYFRLAIAAMIANLPPWQGGA